MQYPKRWRGLAAACLICCATFMGSAYAAGAPKAASAPALPEPLTPETVRELVSRLSDQQVRALLIEQLDRAGSAQSAPAKGGAAATMTGMAGVAGMVGASADTLRERARILFSAFMDLPSAAPIAVTQFLDATGDDQLWPLAGYFGLMIVIGALAEVLYALALRRYRRRLRNAPADTFAARAFRLGIKLLLDVGGIAVFAAGALILVFARWLPNEVQRFTILVGLLAVVIVRVTALIARFLLASDASRPRLLPFDDRPARQLRGFAIAIAVVYSLGVALTTVLGVTGVDAATVDVLRVILAFIGFAIAVATAWVVRRPIANLIRGDRPRGSILGWLADFWPVAATLYFTVLFAAGLSDVLAGIPAPLYRGVTSVLILIIVPIIDMALCRALDAAQQGKGESGSGGLISAYAPIFRRSIHIVTIVVGMLALGQLWDLDLFALARQSLGGRVASSLLGISIVLLAAYMVWGIARMAIDRRLQAEARTAEDVPATRLRTLLPILRATILVTIVVMAAMSILAALGVDILPLLAGASVVGVAIGFGSQTLVRDIVSGAFFLMDDAFRLGEYIEVGDAKGRVEKINVRSVFLRHHRGALNIVPYGEIKRLRNTDRDWSIHVLEFRLTYDTSMLQVKKILKQIGEKLAADPDYAPDIIATLKSGGVVATEDSAIVVRAKFTARPGSNAWVIRRVAYDSIIRAFRENGIRFAHREVTVNVPGASEAEIAAGSAAAATIESQAARTIDKASRA